MGCLSLMQLHSLAFLSTWHGQREGPRTEGREQLLSVVLTLGLLREQAVGLQGRTAEQSKTHGKVIQQYNWYKLSENGITLEMQGTYPASLGECPSPGESV